MNREKLKAWFLLFRPWSYAATAVPFLIAAAMLREVNLRWVAGFVSGVFFQATVNLLNTWGDERSGVDDVPGAIRTTPQVHQGYVSMNALLAIGIACALIASATGISLCFYRANDEWQVSLPLLIAGFIGFLGSINYSTGIRFKYHGLGVPFVAFLMGPLELFAAITLTCPTNDIAIPQMLIVSISIAASVCVIMHGNDMRDIPTDRTAGIQTTATLLGFRGALVFYWLCHLTPYIVSAYLACTVNRYFLLPWLAFPLTRRTLTTATAVYLASPKLPPWRGLERGSGLIHLVSGILYALAIWIVRI